MRSIGHLVVCLAILPVCASAQKFYTYVGDIGTIFDVRDEATAARVVGVSPNGQMLRVWPIIPTNHPQEHVALPGGQRARSPEHGERNPTIELVWKPKGGTWQRGGRGDQRWRVASNASHFAVFPDAAPMDKRPKDKRA